MKLRTGCIVALALLGLSLPSCSWHETKEVFKGGAKLEVAHAETTPSHRAVRLSELRLTRAAPDESGEADEDRIRLTIANGSGLVLWVRLRIDPPRAIGGCENLTELHLQGVQRVDCPLQGAPTEGEFHVEVTAYEDLGQSEIHERSLYTLRFDDEGVGRLRSK